MSVAGSFDRGCGMLLKDLVDRRLLCPVTQPHTSLSFAVSDLKDRFVHESREIALGHTEEVMQGFGGFGDHPYDFKVFGRRRYSARDPVKLCDIDRISLPKPCCITGVWLCAGSWTQM